jgi:Cof subfamily protein (haloacid dehalogenase superfamily)
MSARNEQHIDTSERAPGSERIYDLVAIDVDGTLVTSENKLSPGIAPLIRKTRARGIGVTLVSGRPKLKVMPLLKELGLTLPYIGSGGAYIADPSNNLVIFHCPLACEETTAVVELARAVKAPIISQEPDQLYYEGSLEELEQLIAISKIDITGVENSQIEILRVDDVLQACAEPTKINICSEPGHLLKIERKLRLLNLPIYLTYSAPFSLEITRSGINKGEALKILATYLAIPLEHILVIGDSHNDISMFEIAGMAVAMSNAPEEVKAAADLVAPSNDEDGVAWVLRDLVLRHLSVS